jgi:putative membrane protein
MILPGISGSFILLIMGMYEPIITAVHTRELVPVLVFILWTIVGLLSFVRLVKYMFTKYHDSVIVALIGLMLGSLPKLRPWSQTEFAYSCPTTTPWGTILAIVGVFLVGYLFVKGIEKYAQSK